MSANRKPQTEHVRGQGDRIFQPHSKGVLLITFDSLYISKVFFFPQMLTWEKAKAFWKQSIDSSPSIAMSGRQYLWDRVGKVCYWTSATLYTSFIEFRGYDSFLQQHKSLLSPNLLKPHSSLGEIEIGHSRRRCNSYLLASQVDLHVNRIGQETRMLIYHLFKL